MCINCEEYFYLGKENEWYSDKEKMYLLRDFLLSHTNHFLKIGGDEWNRAFRFGKKDLEELPTKAYKEFDDKYSKQDFKEAHKKT